MIKQIFDRVVDAIAAPETSASTADDRAAAIRMATAVLMIDIARADHVFTDAEMQRVLELATAHFQLTSAQTADLVAEAGAEAEDLVSVYEFTKLLHEHLDEDEKARIVGLLWEIAYADGELDKYENSLILKISDLLYVSRGRVMRLKNDAAEASA